MYSSRKPRWDQQRALVPLSMLDVMRCSTLRHASMTFSECLRLQGKDKSRHSPRTGSSVMLLVNVVRGAVWAVSWKDTQACKVMHGVLCGMLQQTWHAWSCHLQATQTCAGQASSRTDMSRLPQQTCCIFRWNKPARFGPDLSARQHRRGEHYN